MAICPQCNTQNEEGAVFCDQCGAALTAAFTTNGAAANPAGGDVCLVCGAAAVPGDAFCNECGAALGMAAPAGAAAQPSAVYAAPAALTAPAAPAQTAPRAVIVTGDGQSVELAGKASYLIGREDPVSGIYPEVDTTASSGDAAGVSRRHAEIVQQGGGWFLQDLNSTNGSFVNNQRVAPHTRQPLHPGDQIRLGKWAATFQVN